MTDLYSIIISIIGTPPPGYEPLAYVAATLGGLVIFDVIAQLWNTVAGMWKGR